MITYFNYPRKHVLYGNDKEITEFLWDLFLLLIFNLYILWEQWYQITSGMMFYFWLRVGVGGVCMMSNQWKDEQHSSFINFISCFLSANSIRLNVVPIAPVCALDSSPLLPVLFTDGNLIQLYGNCNFGAYIINKL